MLHLTLSYIGLSQAAANFLMALYYFPRDVAKDYSDFLRLDVLLCKIANTSSFNGKKKPKRLSVLEATAKTAPHKM